MSIEIQPIAQVNVESFHACLDSVARERRFLAQVEAVSLDQMRRFVGDGIAADVSHFVGLDGRRVVGWCDIFPGWAYAIQHCGTLGMGVLAQYRGRGIGKLLLLTCIAKARNRGITRVELEARADNVIAIRLYEEIGFVREGRKRNGMRIDGAYFDTDRNWGGS